MTILKLAAAAAILGAVGIGAAAFAHPHPDGEGEGKKVRQILILDADGEERPKDARTRVFRMERGDLLAHCDGEKSEIDETSGGEDEKQRTRIVICDKGGGVDAAKRAEALEKALARISENDELSPEHRERVTTALREALTRLRETD